MCFPHPKRYKERGPPKSKKDFADEDTIYKIGSSKQQDSPGVTATTTTTTNSSGVDEEQDLVEDTDKDEFSKLFSQCFNKHPFEFIPEAKVVEPPQFYSYYDNSSETIEIRCFSNFKMDDVLVKTYPLVILPQDRASPSSASTSTNTLNTIYLKLKLKDLRNEVSQVRAFI